MSQISSLPGGPTAPSVEPPPIAAATGGSPTAATAATQPTQTSAAGDSSSHAQPTPDQRLLIQETGQTGVFVYTVIDRSSGTVLAQIPQLQLKTLGNLDNYASGQVISTKA